MEKNNADNKSWTSTSDGLRHTHKATYDKERRSLNAEMNFYSPLYFLYFVKKLYNPQVESEDNKWVKVR